MRTLEASAYRKEKVETVVNKGFISTGQNQRAIEKGEGLEWVKSLEMDWFKGKPVYIKNKVGHGSKTLVLNGDGSLGYE